LAPDNAFIINAAWGQANSGMLVAKFTDNLQSITWSTVFGSGNGLCNLSPTAFLVDVCDNIYLSGWGGAVNASNPLTTSTFGMPVTPDALQATTDGSDFYVLVMQNDASDIVYGSYFGGSISPEHVDGGTSRFDRKGIIYQSVCAGCQNNDDFPTFPANVVSTGNNSTGCNTGVFKFDFELPLLAADFPLPPTLCVNTPLQLSSTSVNATQLLWDFGDGNTASGSTVSHTYTAAGVYTIALVANNPATCNPTDTLRREIEILEPVVSTLPAVSVCGDDAVPIGPDNPDPTADYQWLPGSFLSDPLAPNPTFSGGTTTSFVLLIERGLCTDTLRQTVDVTTLSLDLPGDTTLCDEGALELVAAVFPPGAGAVAWSDTEEFTNLLNDGPDDVAIEVTPVTPQTYYCSWTVGECVVESEVSVNLVSFQTTIQGDFSVCAGDTVSLSVQDPNEAFVYNWLPEASVVSGQNTPSVEVVVNDDLRVYVVSETPFNCSALDSVLVEVSPLSFEVPLATATPEVLAEGQESQLAVLPSGYSYVWTPAPSLNNPGIQNTVASPSQTTTYTVLIQDGECAAVANVTVRVVEFVCGPPTIFVPNAFTPDGNTSNDRMFVRVNNIDTFFFAIYNRWGEKVFESTSPSIGWDGTFRGQPCDPDVFVYYLEVDCGGGQSYKEQGNITLIR
jgi:gliding motility-associated-like protein